MEEKNEEDFIMLKNKTSAVTTVLLSQAAVCAVILVLIEKFI